MVQNRLHLPFTLKKYTYYNVGCSQQKCTFYTCQLGQVAWLNPSTQSIMEKEASKLTNLLSHGSGGQKF